MASRMAVGLGQGSVSALRKSAMQYANAYGPYVAYPVLMLGRDAFFKKGIPASQLMKNFAKNQFKSSLAWGTLASSAPYLSASASQYFRNTEKKLLTDYLQKSAPEWLTGMKTPSVTQNDLTTVFSNLETDLRAASKETSIFKRMKSYVTPFVKLIGIQSELYWQERFGGIEHLPEMHQKKLNSLWWRPDYWVKRIFFPNLARKDEILAQGPTAIKKMQLKIGEDQNSLQKTMFTELRKKADNYPEPLRTLFKGYDWMFLAPKEREGKTFKRLLNQVSQGSNSSYKKQIEALLAEARRQGLKIDAHTKIKPIAAGSIGQVFLVEEEGGNKYILKAIKQDLLEEINKNSLYLKATKKYLTHQVVCSTGISEKEIATAANTALEMTNLLKEETEMPKEVANTKAVGNWIKAHSRFQGILEVPEIFASTGDSALMSCVGDSDLINLAEDKKQEFYKKATQKVMPAFLDMTLNSPHKLLDLHQGNVRIGKDEKLYLIDMGRQTNLLAEPYKKLTSLTTQFYLAWAKETGNNIPINPEQILKNKDFVDALTEFIQMNPDTAKNKHYLSEINNLKSNMRSQSLETLVNSLFFRQKAGCPKELETVKDRLPGLQTQTVPTLLHVWANAAMELPHTLTKENVSLEDLTTCREKMLQFTEAYFDTNKKVDDAVIKDLYEQISSQAKTPLSADEQARLQYTLKHAVVEDCTSWKWRYNEQGQLEDRSPQLMRALNLNF